MNVKSSRAAALISLSLAAALTLSACGSDSGDGGSGKGSTDAEAAAVKKTGGVSVTFKPGDKAEDVKPGRPVSVSVDGGKLTGVKVADANGGAVEGELAGDGKSWTSTGRTAANATYSIEAGTKSEKGKKSVSKSKFSTIKASSVNKVTIVPGHGQKVGVGMPVSIRFDFPVTDKKAVEKELKVKTNNNTVGAWGWVKDHSGADRIDWRPKEYWKPGTKVSLDAKLSGVDSGGGRKFVRDYDTDFTVGDKRVAVVNVPSYKMTVTVNDGESKTVPISAGSAQYATWSGTHVVYSKNASETLDSRTVGLGDSYLMKDTPSVVHMTFSGTFLHAAPWNGQIGAANTSHGCIGMNLNDAKWFFDNAQVGDLVKIEGSTERVVDTGNGYGDWNESWADWQKRSAV
jgi:lipoprotein-anchoring transpeptidase ErfK/SrfK